MEGQSHSLSERKDKDIEGERGSDRKRERERQWEIVCGSPKNDKTRLGWSGTLAEVVLPGIDDSESKYPRSW